MDHTLRLYGNPFKQALYLLDALGFVAAGLLLLSDPTFRADAPLAAVAYLCVGFFGLGAVVFLSSLARGLLMRRPLLQVDARGWTYDPALGRHARHVSWREVGRIALYRQRVAWSGAFYLVLEARHPDELPPPLTRALTARLYPARSPVSGFAVKATPAMLTAIGDRARRPERGPAGPHGTQEGIDATYIEEGVVLAGEGGAGQIFGRARRADGHRRRAQPLVCRGNLGAEVCWHRGSGDERRQLDGVRLILTDSSARDEGAVRRSGDDEAVGHREAGPHEPHEVSTFATNQRERCIVSGA
jgi:hypothetical protein